VRLNLPESLRSSAPPHAPDDQRRRCVPALGDGDTARLLHRLGIADHISHRSAGLIGVEVAEMGRVEIAGRSAAPPASQQPAGVGARLRPGQGRPENHAEMRIARWRCSILTETVFDEMDKRIIGGDDSQVRRRPVDWAHWQSRLAKDAGTIEDVKTPISSWQGTSKRTPQGRMPLPRLQKRSASIRQRLSRICRCSPRAEPLPFREPRASLFQTNPPFGAVARRRPRHAGRVRLPDLRGFAADRDQ